MKKISILLFAIVALATFGFVSSNSSKTIDSEINQNELTVLRGAEKTGLTQSNQNW
ncbi:MAG: hypothetical protein RIB47_09810 [Cyclobacteriaceae bacterium]